MAMDEHLTFKNHIDTVKLKLTTANGLLAKLRHYVNPTLLRTIYYAFFFVVFFNSTCDMDVNYGGKDKYKSYKIVKKSKAKS